MKEGDAAPDFVLKDAEGRDVRLSGLQGRPVVLYFYPKDHTAGCTLEAKNFRDHYDVIAAAGLQVVGVSQDSPEMHCGFRDKHELPYTLLSDPDGRMHDKYGARWTRLLGRNHLAVRRCTYLIDANGIIRKAYRTVVPIRHAQQVMKDARELGLLRAAEVPVPSSPSR